MAYTTIDDPEAYFQVKTYTGNGTAIGSGGNSITFDGDTDLAPGMLWLKRTDSVSSHNMHDAVRGAQGRVYPDTTDPEDTSVTESVNAFTSDGFNLGNSGGGNASGGAYVAWCWKAGTTSSGTTTGSGTGTAYSTSIDDTAGFQITTYTGNDTGGHTVPVALSTAPHFMVFKQRNDTYAWGVYHHKNTAAPETEILESHGSSATADDNTFLNDVAPTASVVTLGPQGDWGNEGTKTIVAYFWSEKQGFSKFGSYTGNGNAEGPFVYTGFKPAWLMIKDAGNAAQWMIMDNKRSGYNPHNNRLYCDTNAVQESDTDRLDLLSNGFKVRTGDADTNVDGSNFIYFAFAEQPFVNSEGVPCTAR